MKSTKHVGHGEADIAYHVEWGFRREAVVWKGPRPIRPNFHPVATNLYDWLLRRGELPVFAEVDRSDEHSPTNPYTYHSSALAVIAAAIINDCYVVGTADVASSSLDAEVSRVRLFNEQVLYTARVCESLIKQLLWLTHVPRGYYARASLGQLLAIACRGCRSSRDKAHKISLLGSLAHRYCLCDRFERCLMEHLSIVGRQRNLEAAHSGTAALLVRSPAESRAQLMSQSTGLANDFVHMLGHIRELETRMGADLEHVAASGCFDPPDQALDGASESL